MTGTTNENHRISVVISTHLRPALLANAIMSVRSQTLLPHEVLIVDDASDTATRELVERLAATYPTALRYVSNEVQRGACGSRNLGFASSSSALVAFLDDDDEWDPLFLSCCSEALRSADVGFSLSYVERHFPDGRRKQMTTPPGLTPKTVLQQRVAMTGSSFVIRRAAFDAVGGFDINVPVFNDWDLFVRLVKAGTSYHVVPRPLVRWIEHDGERITRNTLRRAEGVERFLRCHGTEMSPSVRGYCLRLAFGIRKAQERSRARRALLTFRMLQEAGLRTSASIAWLTTEGRIPKGLKLRATTIRQRWQRG